MKKLIALLIVLGALAGGGLGVKAWRRMASSAQEERAFNRAEQFLNQGRPIEALAIHQYNPGRPGSPFDWASLEFRALVAQVNLPRLTAIFQETPERVLASEDGSLTVARAYLHLRQATEFEQIRARWRGRETDSHRWLLLDADGLLLQGKPDQATALLNTFRIPGTNDAPRLLRLALLQAGTDPARSAELLNEAATLAPNQPDTRVFRGQVLEALHRPAEARVEYVAAVVASPRNPIWRDQLAEFYRRSGALDLALATWKEALAPPSLDAIWLKTTFWGRMLQPIDFRSLSNSPPAGRLAPLVAILQTQPVGRFLDPHSIADMAARDQTKADRPEVFWLRLAELLQAHDEAAAADLLATRDPSRSSLDADLERALIRTLAFRRSGSLAPTGVRWPVSPSPSAATRHSYFSSLEDAAASANPPEESLAGILRGKHAFAAAFLAAGWREAGLTLADPSTLPADAPAWLRYATAQALRLNRNPEAALSFLQGRMGDPILELLAAETHLTLGNRDQGVAGLTPLATRNSDAGQRAAWLLAIDALDHQQPAAARRYVESQPRLAREVTGQELLARALLAEGATNAANSLYASLAPQSIEARSFLARSAMARQDWSQARRYTEELIGLLPDSFELRANLETIARAEHPPAP